MLSKIRSYCTGDNTKPIILQFSTFGNEINRAKLLSDLASLAEPEIWTTPNSTKENDILYNYILYTFEKAAKDDLVMFTDDDQYACFNTGLLTENGEDIVGLFNKYTSDRYNYHVTGFRKESDRQLMSLFKLTPKVVSYFSNPERIYFNPNIEVVKNLNHILDEHLERFPTSLQEKGKQYVLSLLTHALDITLKKSQRNYRIAVPQYYNDEITYLLPIVLDGTPLALAVELINDRYRANTVFTIEMAYINARLLMKPEADWLALKK